MEYMVKATEYSMATKIHRGTEPQQLRSYDCEEGCRERFGILQTRFVR
jgi:hypothetical protein